MGHISSKNINFKRCEIYGNTLLSKWPFVIRDLGHFYWVPSHSVEISDLYHEESFKDARSYGYKKVLSICELALI